MLQSLYSKRTRQDRQDSHTSIRADWQRHRDRLLAEGGDWWAASFDDGQNRPPKNEKRREAIGPAAHP
jgi:hypothetical protein